jgi:ribonuclease HII
MSAHELEEAYSWIIKNSWYTTGILNHRSITEHNIYHATLKAMRRSLMQLFSVIPTLPTTIVVDAMPVSLDTTAFEHINVLHFPFGERKSSSIAAASIVAKVTRDTLMRKLHTLFPAYHLDKHKGYGTQVHQEALRLHGASIIHRPHFVENKEWFAPQQFPLDFNKPTNPTAPHNL